jgi:hypothetical protein
MTKSTVEDYFNRDMFVGLVLQTGLTLEELSKWTSATNDASVDRELTRKLRSPSMASSRRWSKADLLLLQSLVLLREAGFDLNTAKFNEHKLISEIHHPERGFFSFVTTDIAPTNSLCAPTELFKMNSEQKADFISKATLVKKE